MSGRVEAEGDSEVAAPFGGFAIGGNFDFSATGTEWKIGHAIARRRWCVSAPRMPSHQIEATASSSGSSGIRRKVEPQRHAECEIKCDAGCDCNGGRIHFLSLYAQMSVCPTMETWIVKMVPLSLENGRLGF
jgi:hypothetical protein